MIFMTLYRICLTGLRAHFHTPFGVPCEHPLPLPLGEVAECSECPKGKSTRENIVKSHIVYRLCNHMVYTLSLIQPGVIVQEIALFECVNSLVQVDAADSELSEHQCDLPRERRLANGDAFPTKPFA